MGKFEIHECKYQCPGVRIENSKSYFHGEFAWQLIITKEANENDLEENHSLENVGDTIWETVVEINNCPYCGIKLRDEKLNKIDFVHFNLSGWSVEF